MRSAALLLLLIATTGTAAAAVYKCPDGAGGYTYTDRECRADAPEVDVRETSFGQSTTSGQVVMVRSNCSTAYGHGQATGYLANKTDGVKDVDLTITFTRRGRVVDSITHRLTLPPFGRVPFDITGARVYPDQCESRWTW